MKIRIPKDIVGTKFSKICTIDMNDFDIDLFLQSLFFTILSQGRGIKKRTNDPKDIRTYIDALIQHGSIVGFDDVEGQKVLERLVRATLIKTGGVGYGAKGEQIMTIVPYSLLAHKPGFPAKGRLRGADVFIYQALRKKFNTDDDLRDFVKKVFGRGVTIGVLPNLGGCYDGETQLDTLTRLSIAFLDGFKPTNPGIDREKNFTSPCPALIEELASDIYEYLSHYYSRMPIQAFTNHLLVLINFELFNYTVKLIYAVNKLVQNPETLPSAMLDYKQATPPQLYIDFTSDATGLSQKIAKTCVRREFEANQQFVSSTLLLRLLDSYIESLKEKPHSRASIEKILQPELTAGQYLQALLRLRNDPVVGIRIDALASNHEDKIREENIQEGDEESDFSWFDEIVNEVGGDVERVVALLVEGQKDSAIQHYKRWFEGVGGLKKLDGILRGFSRNHSSWRYAPTNNLLAVLVQLAAARQETSTSQDSKLHEVQPIRLQDFLQFLEERFGILVDRPPDQFEGAEYAAAARENLRAMLGRLRQMGIFRDLSDDFTVQRLHPPYAKKDVMRMEI